MSIDGGAGLWTFFRGDGHHLVAWFRWSGERGFGVVLTRHSIPIRVRYSETDAMGMLHHANYLNYFEVGRTELFRAQGGNYRRMEEMGMFLVVAKLEVRYLKPARYDDHLILTTELRRSTPARIEHVYELRRDNELLCTAESTLACVDRDGCLQRIPDDLHRKTGET